MRLLVTGGSGFLGGYVLAEAARRGHTCVALARSPGAAQTVAARGAAPLPGDLDDGPAALAGLFARAECDALVNLTSLGFGHAPHIVRAAAGAGLDRTVLVSTTAVVTTLPAPSKAVRLAAEEAIRVSGLSWTILRPTMIYGAAGDRNLSRLLVLLARLRRALRPRAAPLVVPVPGGGRQLQQPVHVGDLAGAVLTAVERRTAAGRTYDLAGPEPLTFADLLRGSAAAVGSRARLVPVPFGPVIALTRGYERLSRRPAIRAEQWQRLAEDKAFPIEPAVRDLDYAPRPFAEGIRAEAAALGLAPARVATLTPLDSLGLGTLSAPSPGEPLPSLAKSPLAPVLGQRMPVRGPARLLINSYSKTRYQPEMSVTRVTTAVGDTFDADLSSVLEWQLWAFGSYERHFAELFSRLVGPGDRCIDVGANVGVHTVRLARLVGRGGEVIAFEPDPEVVQRTRRNVALNDLANVRLIEAAASEQPGEMRLFRPGPADTNRARASLTRHRYLTGDIATVTVTTIDDVLAGAPAALIKIDVEGHEDAVLRGAAGTISRHAPSIVFEYAPQLLLDPRDSPFGWLAGRGYRLFRIRCDRGRLSGRGRLTLDPLPDLPAEGGDLLAVSPPLEAAIASLTR